MPSLVCSEMCIRDSFTRCLRKFAMATKTEDDVDNMVEDIHNIEKAHMSAKRLKESGVYDAQLYSHIGI